MTVTDSHRMNNNRNGIGVGRRDTVARKSIGNGEWVAFDFGGLTATLVGGRLLLKSRQGRDSGSGSFLIETPFRTSVFSHGWPGGAANAQQDIAIDWAGPGINPLRILGQPAPLLNANIHSLQVQNAPPTVAYRISTLTFEMPTPPVSLLMLAGVFGLFRHTKNRRT